MSSPKPRPQTMYQLTPTSDQPHQFNHHQFTQAHVDGDLELRHQQDLKKSSHHDSKGQLANINLNWLWQKTSILSSWTKQINQSELELFRPASLDQECDKSARILYTFTQRGLDPTSPAHSPSKKSTPDRQIQFMTKKIPRHIIQQAEGLAIFTLFRSSSDSLHSSGSGIVIARDSPTTWGPPSAILTHATHLPFLAGVNVYDVVLVLRTHQALMAFAQSKLSIGSELLVVNGPAGDDVSFESTPEVNPVFLYSKSKGIYGGLQLDNTVITERNDENARFYGRKIKAEQLLRGGAVAMPRGASGLIAALDAAEGKPVDVEELPDQIDIAPSEQSDGVKSIGQSRQKLAQELDIQIEPTQSSFVELSSPSQRDKHRTLPPLTYRPEIVPPEFGNASEEEHLSVQTTAILQEAVPSIEPMTPPRPSLPPRRRALPPRHSPHASVDSQGGVKSSPTSSTSSTDRHISQLSTNATEVESITLVDGTVIPPSEKPPEPFQLHACPPSQVSISSAPVLIEAEQEIVQEVQESVSENPSEPSQLIASPSQ
ncbi:hypothetical protein O181_033350, partial [Austropuccinia psidii MF-1]|nr:hypothetical protein [Austropuccinia psidii MF-1]